MKRWTRKEINYLKENYSNKLNKELSDNLNRSLNAISYVANKLGLRKDYKFICKAQKKYKKEFPKELFERFYLNEGRSIREIAKELKLGKNTADYYLKKYKIPKRNPSEANKLRAIKYPNWKKGLSKETDKRIKLMGEKVKKTYAKKRKEKLKEIEKKWKKPLRDILNNLYWNKGFTQEKIAKELDLQRKWIISLMKTLEISRRPNFEYIFSLKGKKHPMYGKKWEDIYGIKGAKKRKARYSLKMRQNIIKRLKNNQIPFLNTKIEKKIAQELNKKSFSFVPQYLVDKKFVCDFALPTFNIIIECDGDYWHANPKIYDHKNLDLRQKRNNQRDKFKDKYLTKKGWKVFRFFESEINKSPQKCVNKVMNEVKKQLKEIKNPLDEL